MTKKAFTLVEMLIVIVIIGILAAALIPRLTGIQSRARDTAKQTAVGQLNSAIQLYSVDSGDYPTQANFNSGTLNTQYLKNFPDNGGFASQPSNFASCAVTDRTNGAIFAYTGSASGYAVTANLENKNGGNAADCTVTNQANGSVGLYKITSQ